MKGCSSSILFFFLLTLCPLFSFSQEVIINEILPSPPPTEMDLTSTTNVNSMYNVRDDCDPPENREWIELYNPNPCDSVDIGCYTLGANASSGQFGSNWGAFTFPEGTKIPPAGFIVIGGNDAQVNQLDFNLRTYRLNYYGVRYIDGTEERWFLRNEYGWIAIYNPQGVPVDAVYWTTSGNPDELYSAQEFSNEIITTTSCAGIQRLPSAENIPHIEYAGRLTQDNYLSFQREVDGDTAWFSGMHYPSPNECNSWCVHPPQISMSGVTAHCGSPNGEATVHVRTGGTGPYSIRWSTTPVQTDTTAINLAPGTYTVTVTDKYNCYSVTGSYTIGNIEGPVTQIDSVLSETCHYANGIAHVAISGGTPPYTVSWNTNPPQASALLQNVHAGTYKATVTDSLGCISVSEVAVPNAGPLISFTGIIPDTCNKGVGSATVMVTAGRPPYSYQWSFPASSNQITASNLMSGSYTVSVTDQVCTISSSVIINHIPGPRVDFKAYPENIYVSNGWCSFTDLSPGSVKWTWDFGDGSASSENNPLHRYMDIGIYSIMLIASNESNCTDSARHSVTVKDLSRLFVPNAFIPDGDGDNDIFKAYGINITRFELMIFNRWGQLVFRTDDFEKGWDGTFHGAKSPIGIYFWIISYNKDIGGNIYSMDKLSGSVTLLRR